MKNPRPQQLQKRALSQERHNGCRFDKVAAELFPEFSRAKLVAWIKSGELLVDGERCAPRHLLSAGNELSLQAQLLPEVDDEQGWSANSLELSVLHEDEHLLVIDKHAGMVVHPAAGHRDDTLVNALLHRYPELSEVPRSGIVHRIDKDTSGLLVVARKAAAYEQLSSHIKERRVERCYDAVVAGHLKGGGRVDQPIARDPKRRTRMAVVRGEDGERGRSARTHYSVLQNYRAHSHVSLRLETGRTHQIRVHMSYIGCPVVGDKLYGAPVSVPKEASSALAEAVRTFPRQALHASRLALEHPEDGRHCEWQSPLPADMEQLLKLLREDAKA